MKILYFLALFIFGPCLACETEKGVGLKVINDGAAIVVTYWCPPAARWLDYTGNWGALSLSAPSSVQAQVMAALKTGRTADLQALVTSAAMPDSARAQLVATRPAAPVVVAKSGLSTTRPTYVIVAGKRNATAYTVRATIGARAACGVAMIVEGSSVYCSWEREGGAAYTNIVTLVSEVK